MERDLIQRRNLVDIGELVTEMLEEALDAYAHEAPDVCKDVVERDEEIDGLCERAADLLIRDLVASDPLETDPEAVLSEAHRLLLTIRDLERVGDHAANIAAKTYYQIEVDDRLLE